MWPFKRKMHSDPTDKPIISGKKLKRLSIPCSHELIQMLDILAKARGTNRAELSHGFVVEGVQKSLGHVFMAEDPQLDKTVLSILERN